MSARAKLVSVFFLLLILVLCAYFVWYLNLKKMIAKFAVEPPPISISAERVKSQLWERELTAVGTFNANKGLDLHPEVSGIIREIHFQSGQMVQQNAPLFTLNDSVEQAQRRQQAAKLRLAKLDFERKNQLGKTHLLDQSTVDQAKANFDEAEAMLAQIDAMIAQKHIKAPFAGQVGIRQISIGEYVSPATALVSLQMISPIHFDFSIPEQFINEIKNGQTIDALIEGTSKHFKGTITAINSQVDSTSHNIQVQATFDNQDRQLTPGVFATTVIHTGNNQSVLTIPQTALTYSLYGDSVFVVKKSTDKDGKAALIANQQTVKAGERRGNEVAITSGVNKDDLVVTSGQLKLHDKSSVAITNQ